MFQRQLASLLILTAACTDGSDPETVETMESDLVATGRVTLRAVNVTADVLTDWGNAKQLSQAIVANHTLTVRYCEKHFPPGSKVLANLKAAVAAYNAVPGLAIEITDIAPAPGTGSHVDPSTFVLPDNAIYFDYDELRPGAYAGTSLRSCDTLTPQQCTKARILISETATDTTTSVGVFMHEIGHAFGLSHINDATDSEFRIDPSDMWFDRSTIHGWKTQADDFRSTLVHAGTLAFLQTYYADPTVLGLSTNEIVVHHNMSTVDGDTHVEWNPSKTYIRGVAKGAIANLNETKLRWNAADNSFEPCSFYGTLPRWFGRMSETSTNTTNTPFDAVFEVTSSSTGTSWTQVATHTFDSVGAQDLRQIDWEKTFNIRLADVGLASAPTVVVDRKLRFRADPANLLAERNESNNEWSVNVCLYPASDTTCSRDCLQPSSPGVHDDRDDDVD